MGYEARFVGGRAGRYGIGHAWVQYFENGKWYLVEPTLRRIGLRLPRLSTLKYKPGVSVGWDGKSLSYYAHKEQGGQFPWRQLLPMVCEWVVIWGWFWLRVLIRLPKILFILCNRRCRKVSRQAQHI